jgi:hypothetical protein
VYCRASKGTVVGFGSGWLRAVVGLGVGLRRMLGDGCLENCQVLCSQLFGLMGDVVVWDFFFEQWLFLVVRS